MNEFAVPLITPLAMCTGEEMKGFGASKHWLQNLKNVKDTIYTLNELIPINLHFHSSAHFGIAFEGFLLLWEGAPGVKSLPVP